MFNAFSDSRDGVKYVEKDFIKNFWKFEFRWIFRNVKITNFESQNVEETTGEVCRHKTLNMGIKQFLYKYDILFDNITGYFCQLF